MQDFEEELAMDTGKEKEDVNLQEDLEEVKKMMEEEIEQLAKKVKPICHVLLRVGLNLDL